MIQGQLQIWTEHTDLWKSETSSKISTTFEDVQWTLKWFFDFSTGFRFSKISAVWSVPSISVAVLGLQDTAEQVRAEYSLGHVKVEVGKDWIQEFLTCQLSTTLRKIDAKNMAAKSQRTKKLLWQIKRIHRIISGI